MLRMLPAVVVASLAFASSAQASPADQAVAYQLGPTHDGHMVDAGLAAPLTQQWSVALPGVISHPLIVNGRVFVTASDKTLYALDQATGAVLWTRVLGATFTGTGIAYDRGRIFALNDDGQLWALDPVTGEVQWNHRIAAAFSSPPTASNGLVYLGGANAGGTLFAVRERDGRHMWTQRFLNGGGSSTPAVDDDRVYVTWFNEDARAFERVSGSPVWQRSVDCSAVGGRTPVVAGGALFVRCVGFPPSDGYILAAATGATLGSIVPGPPPAVADGVAYVLDGSTLKAIAGNGTAAAQWQFSGDGHLDTAPLVVGSLVVVGSSEGKLYALDRATGATSWSTDMGVAIDTPISEAMPLTGLAAANGTLVVPASDRLVAYRSAGPIASVPANQAVPTIDGDARADELLAADVGIWSQLPSSYAYQWLLCDGAGASCADIAGATSVTYEPAATDVGSTLRVRVVATNGNGSSPALTSSATADVREAPPVNQAPPAISGEAREGTTLTADHGTWSGDPTSYAIRWLRCAPAPLIECIEIPGATEETYTVDGLDVGSHLAVRVVATNAGGDSDPAESVQTATVLPLPPVNEVPPTFSGSPDEGLTLTADFGTWTHNPTSYAFQWFSCDPDGTACPDITGATDRTYTVRASDVGRYIGVEVVATNAGGDSEPADSDAFGPVYPAPPNNVSPPTIGGDLQSGRTLTAGPGAWTGSPVSYSFQWYSCDAAFQTCKAEPVTATTYVLGPADVGRHMAVGVVAVNDGGESDEAFSDDGPVVKPAPPANAMAPTITGRAQRGRLLTASPGAWSNGPFAPAYRWLRCAADATGCAPIAGATTSSYRVVLEDVGRRLAVEVVAVNGGGNSPPVVSVPTAIVLPALDVRFTLLSARVRAGGSLEIKLRVRNPGRLRAVATASAASLAGRRTCAARCPALRGTAVYGRGAARASAPGTVTLVVRPTARARRALAFNGRLRVRVRVGFQSSLGGRPSARSRSLTVLRKR